MDRIALDDPSSLTIEDKLLLCLEEIERLNILVKQLTEEGVISPGVLTYAETEAQARRADRQARLSENLVEKAQLEALAKEMHLRAERALIKLSPA